MRVIWSCSEVRKTGRIPKVVPLFGSVPTSGIGMKGDVVGSQKLKSPPGTSGPGFSAVAVSA